MPRSMDIASGRAAERGERREIDVLKAALDGIEPLRLAVSEHMDHRIAGEKAARDDLVLRLIVLELGAADGLLPDSAAGRRNKVRGLAFELDSTVCQHRHQWAEVRYVVDDVG